METTHGLDDIFGYMPFDHFLVVRLTGSEEPYYYPRWVQLT